MIDIEPYSKEEEPKIIIVFDAPSLVISKIPYAAKQREAKIIVLMRVTLMMVSFFICLPNSLINETPCLAIYFTI